MGKVYEGIDSRLTGWIEAQPVFFVATAPLAADGLVNVSPRGIRGTFRVLDEHTFGYADLTGSGIETVAHLRENGRICVMFCSFDRTPKIVRLHGTGRVVLRGEPDFDAALKPFAAAVAVGMREPAVRAVVQVDVHRVSDSCGYGVPLLDLRAERDVIDSWSANRGPDGLARYHAERNAVSLDGLPGLATPDSVSADSVSAGPASTNPASTNPARPTRCRPTRHRPRWLSWMRGALLVAGTTSDAGKSVLVAGICRWLARCGVSVAPFKAQNMSNNSVVTPDGGEIGRAQALQAAACGIEPGVRLNPVLLKPGSDRTSQVVILGQADGAVSAASYRKRSAALLDVVLGALSGLRAEHDVVICEGAGSPTEINLRSTDIANMGLARAASLPVLVVGDIDRGGVLAHLFGTLALLAPADQALVAGFVINKFRGDLTLLASGLEQLQALTGRPSYGVVPYHDELWLDAEDSLAYAADGVVGRPAAPYGTQWLRVAAVRLPRISNGTDVDALACEPGVTVRYVTEPSRLADADLVVLPGSKSTVADLAWLHRTGLAAAVCAHADAGCPVLGICGGYQMLGRRIVDHVESRAGEVPGLGLLDLDVVFDPVKHLGRRSGTAFGQPVAGYEIHHGRVVHRGEPALISGADEGSDSGHVLGTHWHGLFENDAFRRTLLRRVADQAGRPGFQPAPDTSFAAVRAAQLDLLGDLVEEHLNTAALTDLIEHGVPPGLPCIPPGAPGTG